MITSPFFVRLKVGSVKFPRFRTIAMPRLLTRSERVNTITDRRVFVGECRSDPYVDTIVKYAEVASKEVQTSGDFGGEESLYELGELR